MPRVSVVLPFRDAAPTIQEAVQSVLDQGFSDLEVIAVDDGSSDASVARLDTIRDQRLRLLSNEGPAGIVGALNAGLAAASGEWILRMDADDLSLPGRVEAQLEAGASGADVVACGARLVDGCGDGMNRYVEWVNALQHPDEIAVSRFIECPVIHPTAMMRRDRLEALGGYREVPWAEDHDLWLRMLEAGCRFEKVPGVHLLWRDSPRRLTRRDPRYDDRARSRMRAHHLSRLPAVKQSGVVIAGAGPIGKRLARDLLEEGSKLRGFFEVSPRRIGQKIHGVEVVSAEQVATRWRDAVLLGAVGLEGGREQIRELAQAAGRREGADFWAVC
ncbi:MAG: glycosyltransferase [Verrucomicrobiota bacterium]